MKKTWLVFWEEYKHHVLRKRFFLMVFSLPVFMMLVIGIAVFGVYITLDRRPVGCVDPSGFLQIKQLPIETGFSPDVPLKMIYYQNADMAGEALQAGDIQAYFMLPENFPQDQNVQLIFIKAWNDDLQVQFRRLVRLNLTANLDPEISNRLMEGEEFRITSLDETRQMSEGAWVNLILPFAAGLLIMIIIMSSGGYLLQAIVEEKENRTIEMIVTSVSPNQLMTGKILGDIAVGLTQLAVWFVFLLAGYLLARDSIEWVGKLDVPAELLGLLLLVILPTFVSMAAIMAAIGSTTTELREAQQISGYFTVPIMAPYWFSYILMTSPNGPLSIFLSFFPFTAPVALIMRLGFTQIPEWQLALNILELFLVAGVSLWIAGKAFHAGMLRYGKRISLKEILHSITLGHRA